MPAESSADLSVLGAPFRLGRFLDENVVSIHKYDTSNEIRLVPGVRRRLEQLDRAAGVLEDELVFLPRRWQVNWSSTLVDAASQHLAYRHHRCSQPLGCGSSQHRTQQSAEAPCALRGGCGSRASRGMAQRTDSRARHGHRGRRTRKRHPLRRTHCSVAQCHAGRRLVGCTRAGTGTWGAPCVPVLRMSRGGCGGQSTAAPLVPSQSPPLVLSWPLAPSAWL